MRTALAPAVPVLSLVVTGPALAEGEMGLSGRVHDALEAFQERYGFPGATAAIVLPDGTVATVATGLANVEAGRFLAPIDLSATIPSNRPDLPGLAVRYTTAAACRYACRMLTACWSGIRASNGPAVTLPPPSATSRVGAMRSSAVRRWKSRISTGPSTGLCGARRVRPSLRRSGRDIRVCAPRTRLRPRRLESRLCLQPAPLRGSRHHVAFQITSDAGFVDDSSDHVTKMEAVLA